MPINRAKPESSTPAWPYTYAWNRMGRKGNRCRVLIRTKAMNTCMVEFEDGYLAIISRNALRKVKTDGERD